MIRSGGRALAQGVGPKKRPVLVAVKGPAPASRRSAHRVTPSTTDCLPVLAATANLIQRVTGHWTALQEAVAA